MAQHGRRREGVGRFDINFNYKLNCCRLHRVFPATDFQPQNHWLQTPLARALVGAIGSRGVSLSAEKAGSEEDGG